MEYNKVFKIAAFDLDGTLLDSADDLIYSLNILLKEKNQRSGNLWIVRFTFLVLVVAPFSSRSRISLIFDRFLTF